MNRLEYVALLTEFIKKGERFVGTSDAHLDVKESEVLTARFQVLWAKKELNELEEGVLR